MNNCVYLVWETDDGLIPERTLVYVCDTNSLAKRKARELKKGMPDYDYEVEIWEVKKD